MVAVVVIAAVAVVSVVVFDVVVVVGVVAVVLFLLMFACCCYCFRRGCNWRLLLLPVGGNAVVFGCCHGRDCDFGAAVLGCVLFTLP